MNVYCPGLLVVSYAMQIVNRQESLDVSGVVSLTAGNNVSDIGVGAFADAMRSNSTLTYLDIGGALHTTAE